VLRSRGPKHEQSSSQKNNLDHPGSVGANARGLRREKRYCDRQGHPEGKAVETGSVTFIPEDNQGSPITVEIVQGQYTIEDLVPGKKRIFVNLTQQVEPGPDETAASRRESNAERLAGSKKRKTLSKQPAPAKLEGN